MNVANLSLPSSDSVHEDVQGPDLHRLIATVRRRLRLLGSVALCIFVAVMLFTLLQTPRYTATASVMIDTRKHQVSGVEQVLSGLPADDHVIDTEAEIIKSRSLADRVATALNLDSDPEFGGARRAGAGGPVGALRSLVIGGSPCATAHATANREIETACNHEAVVDRLLAGLSVGRSAQTYVINIAYKAKDPAKAALIANTIADRYLLEQLESKFEANRQAIQWLNQRLAVLQPQVDQAESAVQAYKAQHGLLASVGSSLTEQEISNLNTQLDQAKADLAEKDARLRTSKEAQAGSNGENLAGPLTSTTISQLRTQQAEASSKVADLQTKYGPRHPEVQRAVRQLADITAQITAELGRQASNLESEDSVARQRVASLEASLAGAKGTLVGNNAASVQLNDLQRRALAASTLYDNLLNRAKQVSNDQGGEQSDARVVSRARIPDGPSSPNRPLNLALALLLGLVGGVGAVFIAEALDNGLSTSEDVERYFDVPHLGSVPMLASTETGPGANVAPATYVVERPLSAFSEAFRNLRASILFSNVDNPVRVVALTSALPGEGKTTTAVCLGKSMALAGAKTIVVDCDLRMSDVSRLLGIEPKVGLVEVLQGAAKLEDVIIKDEASGAWFLPVAKTAFTPKDLFGSHAMDRLIEQLRDSFDLVLFDTAPVFAISDTRILAPKADVVVVLVQWRKTSRKAVEAELAALTSCGARIAGISLTRVDARQQAKFGYGDAGYYSRSYQKYYFNDSKG